jgi:hypothetical protein
VDVQATAVPAEPFAFGAAKTEPKCAVCLQSSGFVPTFNIHSSDWHCAECGCLNSRNDSEGGRGTAETAAVAADYEMAAASQGLGAHGSVGGRSLQLGCKQCGTLEVDDTSNGRHDVQLDLRAANGGANIGLRDAKNRLGCDGFQVTGATGTLTVVNGW